MSVSLDFVSRRLSSALFAVVSLLALTNVAFGDLLVADNFGNQILRYDQNTGAFIGVFTTDSLSGPVGMRLDGSGNLLVSNQGDNRILKFDLAGNLIGEFYSGSNVNGPSDIQFGPNGNLYVANFGGGNTSDLVSYFDNAGNSLGAYTTGTPTDGSGNVIGIASSFAFNSSGELFVGVFDTGDIYRYDTAGNFAGMFATGFFGASGLNFDSEGDLWLSSLYSDKIFQLDTTGNVKSEIETGANSFPGPIMFAPGNEDELWVSLTGAGGVYKFSATTGSPLGIAAIGGGLQVPGQGLIVSAVPEPGAGLILAGTAVVMMGLRRRRTA